MNSIEADTMYTQYCAKVSDIGEKGCKVRMLSETMPLLSFINQLTTYKVQ